MSVILKGVTHHMYTHGTTILSLPLSLPLPPSLSLSLSPSLSLPLYLSLSTNMCESPKPLYSCKGLVQVKDTLANGGRLKEGYIYK